MSCQYLRQIKVVLSIKPLLNVRYKVKVFDVLHRSCQNWTVFRLHKVRAMCVLVRSEVRLRLSLTAITSNPTGYGPEITTDASSDTER